MVFSQDKTKRKMVHGKGEGSGAAVFSSWKCLSRLLSWHHVFQVFRWLGKERDMEVVVVEVDTQRNGDRQPMKRKNPQQTLFFREQNIQ